MAQWQDLRCTPGTKVTPQISYLRPQTSDLRPQTSDLRPQTTIYVYFCLSFLDHTYKVDG